MTVPEGAPPPSPAPRSPVRPARRALLFGGATVLLLLAAWGGSTLYAAGQAENVSTQFAGTLDSTLKRNALGRVEKHVYARGLMSSTDDLYLLLGDKDPLRLHLRSRIQNGPLPGLGRVGQAVVDSELVWDDPKVQAAVDKAFGGRTPKLHTVVGLGGNTESTLDVPAGTYAQDGGTASWQALSGQVQTSGGGRGVTGTLMWPGVTLSGTPADGSAELKDLKLVLDQQPYLNRLSRGTSSFTIASITLPGNAGRLEGLSAVTTTTPSGPNLGSRTDIGVRTAVTGGQTLSDLKLALSAGGLNSAALEELSATLQKPEYQTLTSPSSGNIDDAALQKLLSELTPGLSRLLAGNPSLKIDEVSVRLPQGRVRLGLGAQVVNGGSIDLKGLLSRENLSAGAGSPALLGLLGNLKLTADIEGNQAAIEGLLGESGNRTAAGIGQSIAPMVEQGMITKTGDVLKTHLEFGKDGASINGKPVPLQ